MASFYEEIESDEEYTVVPTENLISATTYIQTVFELNKVNSAAIGGLAFLVLGSGRETSDVDICVEARFKRIREILEQCERLKIPRSKLVSGVLRVYCRTGKETGYDDCKEKHLVQIDIKECGEGAGPRELDEKATMLNPIGSEGAAIRTLNHTQLLRAKLKAWDNREDQKFDRHDIRWMLEHHGDKIDASQLNQDIAAEFVKKYDDEKEREKASKILGLS